LFEPGTKKALPRENMKRVVWETFKRIGYLNERTSLAHCVWLSDEEYYYFSQVNTTVVHGNPVVIYVSVAALHNFKIPSKKQE
jgi:cytosine/adenosine deaminase-related metal-dependent hydrolase